MKKFKTVDLSSLGSDNEPQLQLVKLGKDQTPVFVFTPEGVEVTLHYCEEPELNAYYHCNGGGCVLCTCGKVPVVKYLLPVYAPLSGTVAVLPVSTERRPFSLAPQLTLLLNGIKEPQLTLIQREQNKFHVQSRPIPEDVDDGAPQIKRFLERFETGEIDLTSVYPRLSNSSLAEVPGIFTMLKLKGLTPDDVD